MFRVVPATAWKGMVVFAGSGLDFAGSGWICCRLSSVRRHESQ